MPKKYLPHYIKPNHANSIPRRLIAFDTECQRTVSKLGVVKATHSLRLGTLKSARIVGTDPTCIEQQSFNDSKGFWDYLHQYSCDDRTTWCVAHGIIYDLQLLNFQGEFNNGRLVVDRPRRKRQREKNDYDDPHCCGIVAIDGLPIIITCRSAISDGRIVFVDSLNYFKMSLRKLGDSLGVTKLDMPAWEASDEEWRIYCERDTDIVFESMLKLFGFTVKYQLGNFRYTAASQSMASFRHGRMPCSINLHHDTSVKALERASYYGGRVECYRLGEIKDTCHLVDVNSMYPSVMQNGFFPTELISYDPNRDFGCPTRINSPENSVARVRIHCDWPLYPKRRNNGVFYPIGDYETILCGSELAAAIRNGHCISVAQYSSYDTSCIFKNWVSELWSLKQGFSISGNKAFELFTKNLLTCLHGKFAQWASRWIPAIIPPPMPDWSTICDVDELTGEITNYRSIGGYIQQEQRWIERDDTFVAISGFITAAARCRMNYLMSIAGKQNVFYLGVDALLVNDTGLGRLDKKKMLDEEKIGYMKVKYSGSPTYIHGCSRYEIADKVIMSGLPGINERIGDSEWLATTLGNASDIFHQESNGLVLERDGIWRPQEKYTKGVEDSCGSVIPHTLKEF